SYNIRELEAAHARVSKQFEAEFAKSPPPSARTIEQIHGFMDELARMCTAEAQSSDDHMFIYFCATGYVQLMLEHVIGDDVNLGPVLEVGLRLLREDALKKPSPTPLYVPALTNIIPEKPILREVTRSDIATWRSHPEELLGKRFTTSQEYMRNAFLISDYSVKTVKGAQYDVLYQNRKEEEVVGKDELLEDLAGCYLNPKLKTTSDPDLFSSNTRAATYKRYGDAITLALEP
ncbi:hypothetical protein H0H92_012572, partial [Tricholoma furcatifolium]